MVYDTKINNKLLLYLAFRLWAYTMPNTQLLFRVDNEAVCYVLSNHTSHDKQIMQMLRHMILLALKFDIVFSAVHLPGHLNVVADKLSRLQTAAALEADPGLDRTLTLFP